LTILKINIIDRKTDFFFKYNDLKVSLNLQKNCL